MDNSFPIPFYAKVALILISAIALVFTMFIAQGIIIPILYATIIAILLNPIVNFLMQKKINKLFSISIVVALTIVLVLGVIYVVSTRFAMFSETYPQLKQKLDLTGAEILLWVSEKFNIHQSIIIAWLHQAKADAINNFALSERLSQAGQLFATLTLLPVYLFLLLYYKTLLLEFIHKLFSKEYHSTVAEVLTNSKKIIQSYLVGLVFELVIVSALNSIGLLLLGIQYAIILGIIGAVLNIIPYIGGVVATVLMMVVAFITKDSLVYPMLVLALYLFIQFVDNSYIVPKIVASKVQINALVSIIVVLIGGALWGVSGMFLSIPLTAILKVIFDHIEPLKPWGYLLGNTVPTVSKRTFIRQTKEGESTLFKKIFRRAVKK